eukprot:7194109-Lingulodinium_polyedra.AAC.1
MLCNSQEKAKQAVGGSATGMNAASKENIYGLHDSKENIKEPTKGETKTSTMEPVPEGSGVPKLSLPVPGATGNGKAAPAPQ